ncbi:hypothetical protein PIB30_029720 [Stylosanthes scabra]|uniref:Uncharacterized protein n=1 Tax=Stylosanthes scabra TaxID=79078 RepID=A0ABU6XC82_9FABA|nr:hypothetical protein [Stylosanthes scabra]
MGLKRVCGEWGSIPPIYRPTHQVSVRSTGRGSSDGSPGGGRSGGHCDWKNKVGVRVYQEKLGVRFSDYRTTYIPFTEAALVPFRRHRDGSEADGRRRVRDGETKE